MKLKMIAADLAAARVQLLQRKIADVEKRSRRALTNEAYLHDMHQLQRLNDQLIEARRDYYSLTTDCVLLKRQAT